MKRMVCIGAQSVAAADLAASQPGVVMPCRRDSGDGQHRTYVAACPEEDELVAHSALQLPLFEELAADAR